MVVIAPDVIPKVIPPIAKKPTNNKTLKFRQDKNQTR
jgi:hypothetical protein